MKSRHPRIPGPGPASRILGSVPLIGSLHNRTPTFLCSCRSWSMSAPALTAGPNLAHHIPIHRRQLWKSQVVAEDSEPSTVSLITSLRITAKHLSQVVGYFSEPGTVSLFTSRSTAAVQKFRPKLQARDRSAGDQWRHASTAKTNPKACTRKDLVQTRCGRGVVVGWLVLVVVIFSCGSVCILRW